MGGGIAPTMSAYPSFTAAKPFRRWMPSEGISVLTVAVLLPGLVWQVAYRQTAVPLTNVNSLFGAVVAVIGAVWLSRNFARYPGIRGGSHVLGAVFASFAVVASGFLFFRINYSTAIFFSSFGLATGWLVLLNMLQERQRVVRIGLVPSGQITRLHAIPGVEWSILSGEKPDLPLTAVGADLHSDMPAHWERQLADYALEGIPVYHYKQLIESLTGRVEVDHLAENSFGSLLPSTGYLKLKILLDRVLAAAGLIALSPLLVVLVVLVRLDSAGPAIFRQERIGFRGRTFVVYKFRTMRSASTEEKGALQSSMTQHADDRITKLGRVLRRSRLDELPQMINILRGEMSWIGPRPEAAVLSRWYEEQIPFYRYRHIVPPGITGWAQVNQGHVTSVEDVQRKLNFDFYYVKHFSLWLDIVISFRTALTMLNGRGAI
ncbi:MAG TPA: sugar transferase [Sphingomicrobium sp.]|jgi:lipopolysaccharide/colanic/teichoic acid biosynthesis glycosyltransferase